MEEKAEQFNELIKKLFIENISSEEKCAKLLKYRFEFQESSIIDFENIYFCYLNENKFFILLFCILTILFLFKLMCNVVEEYISPALTKLSDYLKLPNAIANATLIAFANGAGDVITSIVSSEEADGINIAVGQLYGSGLFIITLVLGFVIIMHKDGLSLWRRNVVRDIGFLILANVFILYTGFVQKKITYVTSIVLILMYIVYVIVVSVMSSKRFKPRATIKPERMSLVQEALINDKLDQNQNEWLEKLRQLYSKFNPKKVLQFHLKMKEYEQYYEMKKAWQDNQSQISIFLDVLNKPLNLLIQLTIPPCDEENYNHEYTIAWPMFGYVFLMWSLFGLPSKKWFFFLPFFVGFQIMFQTWKPENNKQKPKYFFLLVLLGIFIGVLWNKVICEILVSAINFIGIIFNIPQSFLAMFVLSIGNALPDGLTTIAIAKKGDASSVISAGIACSLFSLLVALGSTTIIQLRDLGNTNTKEVFLHFNLMPEKFEKDDFLIMGIIGCALLAQTSVLIYGFLSKFVLKKPFAYFLFALYLIFICFGVMTVIK